MPVLTAQSYIASLLDNLTPPGRTGAKGPVSAMITPLDPDVNPDGIPRVYVWPSSAPESRLAFPRNSGMGTQAGWKQMKHQLMLFLVWMDSQNDVNADSNFPLLIDWVMQVLRTSPNPATWTDPDTGLVSNIVNVGEDMKYDYVPPRLLAADRYRRYDARITITLLELFQA